MDQDPEEQQSAGVVQFLRSMWRWRLVLLAIIATVMTFSTWQGMHVVPVYRSRTVIEIGYVGLPQQTSWSAGSKEPASPAVAYPLESVSDLKQRLVFANWEKRKSPSSRLPRLQEIEIDRRINRYVVLVAYGTSPEAARGYLQTIGDKLIAEHRAIFDRAVLDLESQLSRVKRIGVAIQAQTATFPKITRQSGPEEVMLAAEKLRLLEVLPGLLQWQVTLERAATPSLNRPTQYVKTPEAERKPISYGLAHHLAIGALLGLILAGLFVVVLERVWMKIAHLRSHRAP